MGLFGGNQIQEQAEEAKREEIARQERIKFGTQMIRQQFADTFNSPFYQKQADDMWKVGSTDLNKQWKDAYQGLQAALVRTGNLGSSAGTQKLTQFDTDTNTATNALKSSIQDAVQQRKGDIANSENAAVTQLTASADPYAASAQAANFIKAQSGAIRYQPFGQVFQDATAGLATQADLERQGLNQYNLGISNWWQPRRGATKNVI